MSSNFRPALLEAIDAYLEAIADKEICVHEHMRLAADGCQVVESLLDGLAGDDTEFNQLVGDLEWAVQTHIIPLDLTKYRVPAIIERCVIDPQLVPMVRPALEALRPKPHAPK